MTAIIPVVISLAKALILGIIGLVRAGKKEKPPRLQDKPASPVVEDGARTVPIVVGTALLTGLPVTSGRLRYYRDRRGTDRPQRLGGNLEMPLTTFPFALLGIETAMPDGAPMQFTPVRDEPGNPPNFQTPMSRSLPDNTPYVMANPGTTADLMGTSPPTPFPFPWTEPGGASITNNAHTAWWADYDARTRGGEDRAISTLFVRVTLQRQPAFLNPLGTVPDDNTDYKFSGSNIGRLIFTGAKYNSSSGNNRNFLDGTNPRYVSTGPLARHDHAPADWGPNLPPISAWVFKDPRSTEIRPSNDWPVEVSEKVERHIEWETIEEVEISPGVTVKQRRTDSFTWIDINPADILIAILTSREWGMGIPIGRLDMASFDVARDVLRNDGHGMSFVIDQETTAAEIIGRITGVIQGAITRDEGGWYRLDLLRPTHVDGNTAVTLSPSNSANYKEVTSTSRFEEVRGEFFHPLYRRVQQVSETAFSGQDAQGVLEVDLFGITDPDLARRIVRQRATEAFIQPAAIQVDVAVDVAEGLSIFEGVVLKWGGRETMACYVMDVQMPDAQGEWASVTLQEAWDSTFVPARTEELDPIEIAAPLPITLLRERTPYFHWAKTYLGNWDFTTMIGEAGDNQSWPARSIAYAKRPALGNQDGWVFGEKRATSAASPVLWSGQQWLSTVEITGSAVRNLDTTITTTNLYILDTSALVEGHILRVPVEYPELDFPDTRAYVLDHEYVQVVEVISDQLITVARGMFDTSVAPLILAGEARVIGLLPLEEQASGPWYAANTNQWVDYGTHGETAYFQSNANVVGQLPVMDHRGLGVKGGQTLPWDDGTSQFYTLPWTTGKTSGGQNRYASRAIRPYDAGAAYVDMDGTDIVIRFEGRNRTAVDHIIPRSVPGADAVGGNTGSETGRQYELWVFGDGDQVGHLDHTDITNSSFVITPGMLSGWGGPFTDLEFALAGVWPSGQKDIPSWQYTYLKFEGEIPGDRYDETAHGFGKGAAAASESYQTPGAYYEHAYGRGKGRVTGAEVLVIPPYMESATGYARASSSPSEELLKPAVFIGDASSTATQVQTAGGTWKPSFSAIGGTQNGDRAYLAVMSHNTGAVGGSGWTAVHSQTVTGGRLHVFHRVVDAGFNNGNSELNVPSEAVIAATLVVVRGADQHAAAGVAGTLSGGATTMPGVYTPLSKASTLSVGFSGHAGSSNVGYLTAPAWSNGAQATVSSGGHDVVLRASRYTQATMSNGWATGTTVNSTEASSPTQVAMIHVAAWEVE